MYNDNYQYKNDEFTIDEDCDDEYIPKPEDNNDKTNKVVFPKQRIDEIIINMSDYFNLLILQGFVNLNTSSSNASTNIDAINNINSLYSAIQTLNSTMKFIDSV